MSPLPFPGVGHWPFGLSLRTKPTDPALRRGKVGLRGYVSTELDEVPSSSPGFAAQAQMEQVLLWRGKYGKIVRLALKDKEREGI